MASFFRKRIAQKVLSMLQRRQELRVPFTPNLISPLIKVNRHKSPEPQLILPWKGIEEICDQKVAVNPNEFVRLLRNQGLPTAEGVIDIELTDSPLSLIFTVDKHIFSKIILLDICTNEDDLARNSCFFEDIEKKNIIIQCSLPSIGELFHLTHFRTVIHTNYVANINKFVGHNVMKIGHVNDWGLNAAIFLTGYKQFKIRGIVEKENSFNLSEVLKAALMQYQNDIKFKLDSDACYDKMNQGDVNILSEWRKLKEICIKYYDSVYQRLGIHFDALHFDSSCIKETEDVFAQLLDNNVFNRDVTITDCDELKNITYINDITDLNSALYDFSRYISAAVEMKNIYDFDKMYYISPSSQDDFISALFYLMKNNYEWANELHHISLQVIDSFDSKRRQKFNIHSVLDKVKDSMIEKLHEKLQLELNESLEIMAENLSVSSLIVNDMKQRRKVNYNFDFQDIVSFKRDTAASFQLCSAGLKGLQEDSEYIFKNDIDLSPLLEPEAHYLIQHLARFDEMVFKSYTYLEPCFIFQYLCSLWYFADKVTNIIKLDIKENRLIVIKARLMLLSATLKVLNKGLYLLGITPLETVYSPEKPFVENS